MQVEHSQASAQRLTRPATPKSAGRAKAIDWALSIAFAALLVAAITKAENAGPHAANGKPGTHAVVQGHPGSLALSAGEFQDRLYPRDASSPSASRTSTGYRETR